MSLLIQGISVSFITVSYFAIISNYFIDNTKEPLLGIVLAMVVSMAIITAFIYAMYVELIEKEKLPY